MKTTTKTFYVSDSLLENIKNNSVGFSTNQTNCFKHQIQISYQEPEKKIEITESEFDRLTNSIAVVADDNPRFAYIYELKQKLFGARDE